MEAEETLKTSLFWGDFFYQNPEILNGCFKWRGAGENNEMSSENEDALMQTRNAHTPVGYGARRQVLNTLK